MNNFVLSLLFAVYFVEPIVTDATDSSGNIQLKQLQEEELRQTSGSSIHQRSTAQGLICVGENIFKCPDGTVVERNEKTCAFDCPDILSCKSDVFHCTDGTIVTRNIRNKCLFDPCPIENPVEDAVQELPDDLTCFPDIFECPDGTILHRAFKNNCEFGPCPIPLQQCSNETKECPDGRTVRRDIFNNCEFAPCFHYTEKDWNFLNRNHNSVFSFDRNDHNFDNLGNGFGNYATNIDRTRGN